MKALSGDAFYDHNNTGPRASYSIPDGGTFSIYSETLIRAPPQAVYDAILDIQNWKGWNSFVYDVQINAHPNAHDANLRMRDGVNMTFFTQLNANEKSKSKETCTWVDGVQTRKDGKQPFVTRIRWDLHNAGAMIPSFVLRAQRTNEIEELEDSTTMYRTWETFGGLAAAVVKWKYEQDLKDRFDDWCRDLKKHVEKE
ncbi:hypothetical protein K470DRAFT_259675 [Piedraia hortae CBS 480.64]|uniref:Bet v1-like protein n=1 Tax=Piedraia hortae CBS 480.64 TaxID=1314780 RepID=A0A6A7BTK6_9PEZI|nr:hypothetical protein K470DRAFT_259675 [Piedraia hortae CBS 480.64]